MDNPTPKEVAQRITLVRQEKGISMLALATQSTIPLTTLQRRLGNETTEPDGLLTLQETERLSRVLGVPVSTWLSPLAA